MIVVDTSVWVDFFNGKGFAFDMVGREVALRASEAYRTLRQKGVTVRKTIDVLIATSCVARGYALLHQDRDFDAMERHLDLVVIRPR